MLLETDREKKVGSCLWIEAAGRGGVNGVECVEALAVTLVVLALGEGVNGMRPPAVLEEKRPWWLFTGVQTEGVAMVRCCDRMDKLMFRS